MPGVLVIRLAWFFTIFSFYGILMSLIWGPWWLVLSSPSFWLGGYLNREALKYWMVTQCGHEIPGVNCEPLDD